MINILVNHSFVKWWKKVIDREKSILVSSSPSSSNDNSQSCSKKRKLFGEDYETGNVSDEYDIDDDELER